MDSWTDQGATDAGQHLLTCGECNGFPHLGRASDCPRDAYCPRCDKPTAKGNGTLCRSCALTDWRASL